MARLGVTSMLAFLALGCAPRPQAPAAPAQPPRPTMRAAAVAPLRTQRAVPDPDVAWKAQVAEVVKRDTTFVFDDGATAAGVAVVDGSRTATVYLGTTDAAAKQPFDADTLFEIGSLSKVFTGLLLADAVVRGEVQLTDPVNRYLPSGYAVQAQGGFPITLLDAAVHAADFPLMPTNWVPPNSADAGWYSLDLLRAFLAGHRSAEKPGSAYHYSNVGSMLIGLALATRDQASFSQLLGQRIYVPLGMMRSGYGDVTPPDENFLKGYLEPGKLALVRPGGGALLGPCCRVRTTVGDMATFLRAAMDPASPLSRAFALLAEPRHRIGDGGATWSTLGWVWRPRNGALRKDGVIDGKLTVAVITPARHQGIFLVYNTEHDWEKLGDAVDRISEDLFGQKLAIDASTHAQSVLPSLPDDATHTSVEFEHGLRIEGWRAPKVVHPGDTVPITLYFRAGAPLDRDWEVFVHGDATKRIADRLHGDHYPSHGTDSTLFWKPGELVADSFELVVPADYRFQRFRLWFGLYDGGARLHVVAGDSDGHGRIKGPGIHIARRK